MQEYGVGFAASLLALPEKIPVATQISPYFQNPIGPLSAQPQVWIFGSLPQKVWNLAGPAQLGEGATGLSKGANSYAFGRVIWAPGLLVG